MDNSLKVFISSDHAGFRLKRELVEYLQANGHTVIEMGAGSEASCDYPPAAHELCHALLEAEKQGSRCFGILICGSGIGMSITANRLPGIRAALCTHEFHAKGSRQHNNANVLCLGERVTAPALAVILTDIFLNTPFEGGRHQRRVELIEDTGVLC